MQDEPRRHPIYMWLLVVVILATSPFLFIGKSSMPVWGLPLWLWSSILFTGGLSTLTAWGIIRYWKDDSGG